MLEDMLGLSAKVPEIRQADTAIFGPAIEAAIEGRLPRSAPARFRGGACLWNEEGLTPRGRAIT